MNEVYAPASNLIIKEITVTLRLSFLVAALSTSASLASAQPPPAFTDVYYVQFAKALPGQAPVLQRKP